jgi:hypothetical protein
MTEQLTKITDSKLMEIRDASDKAIYKIDPGEAFKMFREQYPNYSPRNGLQMRAIMAGDVEIVHRGSSKFFLILADEVDILDRKNAETRAHNRKVRAYNKVMRQQSRAVAIAWAEENGLGDLTAMLRG